LATSSVQFGVELVKGDVVSAFEGGAASADGGCFSFRGGVERVAAFIDLRGMNGDSALANGTLDQITWLYAGLSGYGLRNIETPFLNGYGHRKYR
jgi:hypothetical protein